MTDEEFVRSCFERFLRRPAEKEGLDYYLQRLAEGADRLDVVQGIVVGEEFLALLMRQAFGTHVGSPVLAFAPPGHYYSPIPVEGRRRALGDGQVAAAARGASPASTSTSTAS